MAGAKACWMSGRGDALALHIVAPPGQRRPARVQALADYLAEGLAGEPWSQDVRGS